MNLLKEFFGSFSGIMKQYLSAKYFPNVDDTRLVTHYGYIIDLNHVDYLLSEHEKTMELEQ